MKLCANGCPLAGWLARLLGLATPPTDTGKSARRKPRPRHRHSAFLELP